MRMIRIARCLPAFGADEKAPTVDLWFRPGDVRVVSQTTINCTVLTSIAIDGCSLPIITHTPIQDVAWLVNETGGSASGIDPEVPELLEAIREYMPFTLGCEAGTSADRVRTIFRRLAQKYYKPEVAAR